MKKMEPCNYLIRLLVAVALLFTITVSPGVAAQQVSQVPDTVAFKDVGADFWAKTAIDNWSSRGIIQGDGNNFNPRGKITRAEMMTITGRIFGYAKTTTNPFADLKQGDWYYNIMIKAYAQGIMQGRFDEKGNRLACPNDSLTRAEAAVLFQRIFFIPAGIQNQSRFKDANIPDWAREGIFGLEAAGYVTGSDDGYFYPQANLTRAEAVQMIDNIIKLYICQPGNYSEDVNGNVVVNTPDVVLKDMIITGNLYLAEGIADGAVSFENIKVSGSTYIRSGTDKFKVVNCDLGIQAMEKNGINTGQTSSFNSSDTDNSGGANDSGKTGDSDDSGNSNDAAKDNEKTSGGEIDEY